MGALLSQAVANQLRQFPQSQDPRPSPPVLLQQVLNPPGPQESMRFAGLGEQNQLLQLSMDPNLTPAWKEAINTALNKEMLNTALAFGGADITKEQRLKWEAENEAYRADRALSGTDPKMGSYPPGTRVMIRPRNEMGPYLAHGSIPGDEGFIIDPQNPGKRVFAQGDMGLSRKSAPKDHVAVSYPGSKWWFWRHRDDLEVLPPLPEFKEGDMVEYGSSGTTPGGIRYQGIVYDRPPPGHASNDDPDYVWVDVFKGTPSNKLGEPLPKGMVNYGAEDHFGAWFHRKDLTKLKK